jgi:hypothetical protein
MAMPLPSDSMFEFESLDVVTDCPMGRVGTEGEMTSAMGALADNCRPSPIGGLSKAT